MQSRLFDKCPVAAVTVSMILGIIIAHYVSLSITILPVLAGMVVVALLLYKFANAQSVAIVVCCLLLGMCVMQHHQQTTNQPQTETRLDRSRNFFLQQREQLLQRFNDSGLDGDAYAVVAAMSLGDKSALTRDVKSAYSVSGASHVLALSGLHLGIIYMLLSLFLPRRRWPALSQLLMILVVWAFVLLVGMPVSAVRSAVMLTIYGVLSIGRRNKMSVNVLAFTAFLMLMWNPAWLFDVGFQMSFMAVWAILLFVPLFTSVFSDQYYMEPLGGKGLGHGGCLYCGSVGCGTINRLLLRTVLYLFSAYQLPGGACGIHYSLSVNSRSVVSAPRVPIIIYSEWVECVVEYHRHLSGRQYR